MAISSGSSPLARGTPGHFGDGPWWLGLIPARAGNTWGIPPLTRCRRAHPRSRGEHPSSTLNAWTHAGSSPLARGTRYLLILLLNSRGLIPARAGNTLHRSQHAHRAGAHPRSRGEHSETSAKRPTCRGSSPLARGTLNGEGSYPLPSGLIPARAGNTRL